MKKADLHIHSCLSPCGDLTMIPSVVCSAELDIIGITDHNTARNIAAFALVCKDKIIVPGIEIHTMEDVHVLGYFPNLDNALEVSEIIEKHTTKLPYDPEKYGYQLILDSEENFVETIDYYLGFPTNLTIDETIKLINENNGIAFLAHVDRKFGAIEQLGFIPPVTKHVEVRKKENWIKLKNEGYIVLTSSDAHTPEDVGSRKIYFDEEVQNASEVLKLLSEGRFKTIWDL